MDGIYPVTKAKDLIGNVHVDRSGLYYRFRCRCCLTGEVMYRILVCCGEVSRDLGILVPMEEDFGLTVKVPIKVFPSGQPKFIAVPRHGRFREDFVSLSPQDPHVYINNMKARLLTRRKTD